MSADAKVPVGSKVKTATGFQRVYTAAEVAQHNKDDDCWLIIHGKVYDVNGFLLDHPGGPEMLTNEGGTDSTTKFEDTFHSDDARRQLKDFCVGDLEGYTGPKDAALRSKKPASGSKTSDAGMNPALYAVAAVAVVTIVYLFVL